MADKKLKDVYFATVTGRDLKSLARTFSQLHFNVNSTTGENGKVTQFTVSDYTTDMAHEVVGFLGIKGKILGRTLDVNTSSRRRVPV